MQEGTIRDHGNRVLILGGGGREHALAWALSKSPMVEEVLVAPGNPGIAVEAKCRTIEGIPLSLGDLVALAVRERITLAIPGNERAIADGVVNALASVGISSFGPRFMDAELEWSKCFAKHFMSKYKIPTAPYKTFSDFLHAERHLCERARLGALPVVIKADGLADGKGVEIACTLDQALDAARRRLERGEIVIEDWLEGEEVSVTCLAGPGGIFTLESARDHKQIRESIFSPMTGGILTYSPAPGFTQDLSERFLQEIVFPALDGLKQEKVDYVGVLYFGGMRTTSGLKLLEFNCRFGDPEAEVIIARYGGDLFRLIASVMRGDGVCPKDQRWNSDHAVTVVVCAPGYPATPEVGKIITGIEAAETVPGIKVFHSGTRYGRDGEIVSARGRVLAVTALGSDLAEAKRRAYTASSKIKIEGGQYVRRTSKEETPLITAS